MIDLAKARTIMDREKIDLLVVGTPENFYYTTGMYPHECDFIKDHIRYAVIAKDSAPFVVAPDYEVKALSKWGKEVIDFPSEKYFKGDQTLIPAAERYLSERDKQALATISVPESVLTTATRILARVLEDRGLDKTVIGIERRQRADLSEGLRAALPKASFKNGSIVFEELRMIKSKDEIDYMRKATQITETALQAAIDAIEVGVALADLKVMIRKIMSMDVYSAPVGVGADTWFRSPPEHNIREGEVVRFDVGAKYKNYCSDFARNVAVGRIPKEWERLFGTLLEAQQTIVSMAKPGARTDELFKAGMEIIRRVDPDYRRGHLGHGVGIDFHEKPHIAPGADGVQLRPSMVLTVETPYYAGEAFVFNCEDILIITDDGCEVMSSISRELHRK